MSEKVEPYEVLTAQEFKREIIAVIGTAFLFGFWQTHRKWKKQITQLGSCYCSISVVFISPLYDDWIVWFTIEVSWSMSGQLHTLLTEIICFLFGKKKKKKKNETESRIFTRHFIVYNLISKLWKPYSKDLWLNLDSRLRWVEFAFPSSTF